MTLPFILPLSSPDATLPLAGGKGMNLSCLLRAGFPAPGGFIVTTDAYRAYVEANELRYFILATANAAPPDDPIALEAASAAIRGRFAVGSIPRELVDAICQAYGALDLGSVAVAVRSSATAEDLPGLSFAGQQDTFLNVVGEEGLLRAMVDCWSSLWTARAIGYRARAGLSHAEVALAVVVQAMVQAEAAGVLFTANPLTGLLAETVIDATLGLGEALVSGRVEPDHYVVGADGQIVSKTLGTKILSADVPGTSESARHVTEAKLAQQALPDDAICELAALGRQVETLFGAPQDVEWAWADWKLWLVQARPITSLYPLPEGMPAEPLQVLASFAAVQGIMDPFTPLGQDVIRGFIASIANLIGYHETLTSLRALMVAGERLYMNLTGALRHGVARRLVRFIPSFVEPAMGRVLAVIWDDPRLAPTADKISFRTVRRIAPLLLPIAGRFLGTLLRPDASRRRAQAAAETAITAFRARGAAAVTLTERLDLLDEIFRTARDVVIGRLLPGFAPGMAALNLLTHLGAELPDGRRDVWEVTRGLPHNVTTEMDLALWAASQAVRADPVASARFAAADASDLTADYLAGRLPPAAQTAVAGFLARYGMRGVGEIDLGRPRWREEPTPVIQAIRSYLQIQDAGAAPSAVFARGATEAETAIKRLDAKARKTRGGWLKARQIRWASRRVRAVAGLRESPKFTIIRLFDVARTALLSSGRELVAAGVLERPEDVFFLHLDELRDLADEEQGSRGEREQGGEEEGAHPSPPAPPLPCPLAQKVAARRQLYDREKLRRQIPLVMLSDGRIFYPGAEATSTASADSLTGSGVSPGVAEGIVRVVLDPRGAQLAPGEILVCPGTDPAWTPLFLAAGGLVMEVGGLMTHGSVVAREYGIPAVVGVSGATTRLKTGQRVRVDGASGQIAILADS
ncbi:MAG: PEP-utilizing enzyme [Chloroflexi bacterium]|nr:PEP-utilizing enzyme [Chloroflexota bacterium]